MGIVKTETVKGVKTITVAKDFSDEDIPKHIGRCLKAEKFTILREDADVLTEDGKVLLRFRKNVLPSKNINAFYDNVIKFASTHKTTNRGIASGTKKGTRSNNTNKPIASNILGYMDTWTAQHKFMFKKVGMDIIYPAVRKSYFSQNHHEQWDLMKPLIKDIDRMYRKLAPAQYRIQRKKADETYFKINDTAFTTITTNVNYNTCIHTDKGDDPAGLGNLVVIQRGEYTGGETCFIQYGVGVDVREGDFLLMDVHQIHGNTKLHLKNKESVRLSIVSYLRMGIWKNTRRMTKQQAIKHMDRIDEFYNKLDRTRKVGKKHNITEKRVLLSKSFAQSEHKIAKDMGSP